MPYESQDVPVQVIDLSLLIQAQQKPEPFAPGEARFWDDPHISKGMLAAHLDPTTDAASRKPRIIDRSVAWLVRMLALHSGDSVLDLGCGPGLYATRFAARGMRVTGVDYAQRSIDYAIRYAYENHLDITYRYQDYRTLEDQELYDAVLLIYGDFCTLAPSDRKQLLKNIYRALKPGGYFALDVSTRKCRERHGLHNHWYAAESGFWRPCPHLVLEQGFDYPEQDLYLDQYVVIEAEGRISVYRNWFQDYDPATIQVELEGGGFAVQGLWGDLMGARYTAESEWIGVVAQKGEGV